jgi:hypothetical protein
MIAIAPTGLGDERPAEDLVAQPGDAICQGHATTAPVIIESDAEQSWSDFCRTLRRPAFLLPYNGFGDPV